MAMTIKALYNWAVQHGCEDYELVTGEGSARERFVDCGIDFSNSHKEEVILYNEQVLW
jgi:hypothetical protein